MQVASSSKASATGVKTVVVTGARGYIGRSLEGPLRDAGYRLRLVSRASNTLETLSPPEAQVSRIAADLRDEGAWLALLADADAVIHLSGRTDLRAAEADPIGDDALNNEPIRALVRACARLPHRQLRVLFASAVTIVGTRHRNPVDEATPDAPESVYDRHKLLCEGLLSQATQKGVLRSCSLRLPNVYGYGRGISSVNRNRGILNLMMQRAIARKPLTLFGGGQFTRDFVYIDDVADAFCRAVDVPAVYEGKSYVIATGVGSTLADAFALIAREARALTGHDVEISHQPEPPDLHPIERRSFVGDSTLFRAKTGWEPRIQLAAGIRLTLEQLLASSPTREGANALHS